MDYRSAWGLLILIGIAFGVKLIFMPRPFRNTPGAHGTGRFSSLRDLIVAGMLRGNGLILGQTGRGQLIRMNNVVHTALFAPTGAGKGVSFVVPWLRRGIPGSVVVSDPKGENVALTALWRKAMGHQVVCLDPFRISTKTPDTFNPLDLIGNGMECIGEAKALAAAMVVRTGEEKDPHWNDRSENLISNALALVAYDMHPEMRNLLSLRSIIADPKVRSGSAEAMRKLGGIFADNAASMEEMGTEEGSGIISTCHRHLDFLSIPEIAESVSRSSFDPRKLLTGKMSIYLVLPAHYHEACSRWMRLAVVSLVRMIMRLNIGKDNCPPIHFILDEAATVLKGGIPAIDEALVLGRSFGIRLNLIFQSFGQVSETFPRKSAVVLGNTTPIFWAVNELDTAKYVSEMLGNRGIVTAEANDQYGWNRDSAKPSATYNSSSSQNTKEIGRPLLYPDEVINCHPQAVIAFIKGLRPVLAWRVIYWQDRRFGGCSPKWRFRLNMQWLLWAVAVGLYFPRLSHSRS